MTRDCGRAPRGERVHGAVPRNRGEVTTMTGALDVRGVGALMTVEGGTDAGVFEAFVEQIAHPEAASAPRAGGKGPYVSSSPVGSAPVMRWNVFGSPSAQPKLMGPSWRSRSTIAAIWAKSSEP